MGGIAAHLRESGRSFTAVLRNTNLRRLQGAWTAVAIGHWGLLVAVSVYAYGQGGEKAVGIVFLLRLVPAGLLAATTNELQTDLVSAPLIWIGPLGAYLASLVVAFSERGRRALPLVERLLPAAAALLWVVFMLPAGWPLIGLLAVEFGGLFILAVAVHGRLAMDRPGAEHLTRFYLILSLGGLLATAFVALVAPLVFSEIYEYPLLVVASVVVLALVPGPVLGPGLAVRRDPRGATVEFIWRLVAFEGVVLALVLIGTPGKLFVGDGQLVLLVSALVVAVACTPWVHALTTSLAVGFLLLLLSLTLAGRWLRRDRLMAALLAAR